MSDHRAGGSEDAPDPWLTVVTVVMDDPRGLRRTLKSIAVQDLAGVEYIVIDSSQDRTAVPAEVASAGVDAIVTWTDPRGIYPAMNHGLDLARGRYIYFANAGDEIHSKDVLARLRSELTEEGPDWLFGDVEIVGVDGVRTTTPPWNYTEEAAVAFSRGRFPPHQGMLVRSSALRSIGGFDVSYSIVADYAAFLTLAAASDPKRLDLTIATFVEGGTSTKRWKASFREFHRARRTILAPEGALKWRERWETMLSFAAVSLHREAGLLPALLAVICAAVMMISGVAPAQALLVTAVIAAQAATGCYWWRVIQPRRRPHPLETLGMGLSLGIAAGLLSGLLGAAIGVWRDWAWAVPSLLALGVWTVRRSRGSRLIGTRPLDRSSALALAVGMVIGLAALAGNLVKYPLSWAGSWSGYHGDMLFFEALSTSMARFWPHDSIFMTGADLRYHSFAYAWVGQVTETTGADPFVVLTRALPLAVLIASVTLVIGWTRRLSRLAWAPMLAVLLVVAGGFVGATYGTILNIDSPSQALSTVWLLALSVLLMTLTRPKTRSRAWLAWRLGPVAVLVAAITGGKVSTAVVAAVAFGTVIVVGIARREPWRWRAVVAGVVSVSTVAIVYVGWLAGSSNSGGLGLFQLLDRASSVQGLNPVNTPRGIVAGIGLLVLAVVPRWAGVTWLVASPSSRWRPSTVYGAGLVLAGVASIVVLSGGFNDLWFALAASAPLAVLSAVGVARSVKALGPKAQRTVLVASIGGLGTAVLAAALWSTGSTGIIGDGWRWAGPVAAFGLACAIGGGIAVARRGSLAASLRASVLALVVVTLVAMSISGRILYLVAERFVPPHQGSLSMTLFSPYLPFLKTRDEILPAAWTDTQVRAGAWIAEHAAPADILATNVTYSPLVPALTGRRTYVSGIHLQAPYGRAEDLPLIQEREAESWAFVDDPTAQTVGPLCTAGVDWIWVDPMRTNVRDWQPYATVELTSEDVIVLKVAESHCP